MKIKNLDNSTCLRPFSMQINIPRNLFVQIRNFVIQSLGHGSGVKPLPPPMITFAATRPNLTNAISIVEKRRTSDSHSPKKQKHETNGNIWYYGK